MAVTVQARLKKDEQKVLERLARQLDCSESEVVRAGLRLLDSLHPPSRRPRIAGLGEFESGIPDLATNKKHMEGFGR